MRVLFFIPADCTDDGDNELQDQFCPNAFYSRKLKPVQTQKISAICEICGRHY